jgi:Zn-dependent peptidase ImmA (M78 family)/transcriptional regulator with XRE-family HTH domain
MFRPEQLVLARLRRGCKKSTLAEAAEVTPLAIANYENGVHEPKPEVLERIATFLNFPVSFFEVDLQVEAIPADAASFRKLSRTPASLRDAALASGEMCVVLNRWIEDNFELPETHIPDLDPGIIEPEAAATLVRNQWGLGIAPISNVLHLMESHGVRVFSLGQQCREIDAFSFWRDGTPFILLGTHKTSERAIFDLAHELGHLILHRHLTRPSGRTEEIEANGFAAAFLMPRADIVSSGLYRASLSQIIDAKSRWKVSAAALIYRLHELRLMSDWEFRENFKLLGQFSRKSEPNSLPREHSAVLSTVMATMRKEGKTRSQIALESIGAFQADLEEFLAGLTISRIEGGEKGQDQPRAILRLVR